jgi:TrmH family RNA methyltransferase
MRQDYIAKAGRMGRMQIGKNNPKLTELRKAIRHGTLTSEGLLPIEGPILLQEAQQSGIEVVDVFVRSGGPIDCGSTRSVYEVEPQLFRSLQDTEHSQGVLATVRLRTFSLDEALAASPALVVVLCRLQDPGNVGTILRVGDAFGATACLSLRETVGFYNGKVVRASGGSLFRLPNVGGLELRDVVHELRSRKISIVGSTPTATATVEAWDWRNPSALLVGNEGGGLNDEELRNCDDTLRIPHRDTVESLNSAIATAVMLYEASKQRH